MLSILSVRPPLSQVTTIIRLGTESMEAKVCRQTYADIFCRWIERSQTMLSTPSPRDEQDDGDEQDAGGDQDAADDRASFESARWRRADGPVPRSRLDRGPV